METKTEQTPTLLDELDLQVYTSMAREEVRALLTLTGKAYECNGMYYVKADEVSLENFDETLKKEAVAYVKRSKVFDYVSEHQGCQRIDILRYMEDLTGDKPHYLTLELMLTILTEETDELYEDDNDRLYTK